MQQYVEPSGDHDQVTYVGLIQRLTKWINENRGDAQYVFKRVGKVSIRMWAKHVE